MYNPNAYEQFDITGFLLFFPGSESYRDMGAWNRPCFLFCIPYTVFPGRTEL